jgi:hypothetical protein
MASRVPNSPAHSLSLKPRGKNQVRQANGLGNQRTGFVLNIHSLRKRLLVSHGKAHLTLALHTITLLLFAVGSAPCS